MKVEKITFFINYFVCIKEFKYSDIYYLILFLKIVFHLRPIFQKLSFICI